MASQPDLGDINDFDRLLHYLQDHLNWPLEDYSYDDLTFTYEPEELGLKEQDAVRVRSIRQLRPLADGQPWGIFFVEFEKKKLPVVLLRRILSHLVLKKRASANSADRARWHAHDILFISQFGGDSDREMAFAHFKDSQGDLPTLNVLGWDGGDTQLKLSHLRQELETNLQWPEDTRNAAAWRAAWSKPFKHGVRHTIRTADALAEAMAELARRIRDAASTLMKVESEKGPLRRMHAAFKTALIHDLTEEGFADTYAQTITYGLLTAAISRTDLHGGKHGTNLVADNVADMVPITNPFLKEMLQNFLKVGGRKGGIDFDELGIQDVVQLFRSEETDLPAVIRDFDNKTRGEDPVIHFYEHFLAEYNSHLRIKRGVFYTPKPVVEYIVRRVDEVLRTEFGIADGLASTITWREMAVRNAELKIPEGTELDSPFVMVLDPATGTATFLVEVIDLVHTRLKENWAKGGLKAMPKLPATSFPMTIETFQDYWNQYVALSLLRRLHGYELMMAPYAIAHMKIGLKLAETKYRFGTEERARVYLTNALEIPSESTQLTIGDWYPALAHEAEEVHRVKRTGRFTVVLGNPPYSDASQNIGSQFSHLIESFRYYGGERIRERGAIRFEHVINNDYVKFLGLGQWLMKRVPIGVLCMITSNSYLLGKSFRGVRETLRKLGEAIRITDLHGEGWSGNLARAGVEDENVFEIQTGVATCLLLHRDGAAESTVEYGEVVGTADYKGKRLRQLNPTIPVTTVQPNGNTYDPFVPDLVEGHSEYWTFPQLDKFFHLSVDGIKTSRDGLVIANTEVECFQKAQSFASGNETKAEIEERLHFTANNLDLDEARVLVKKGLSPSIVYPIAYRPFDLRSIYYSPDLILSHRMGTMPRILHRGAQAIVCASRLSGKGFNHALASRALCAHKYSSHDINSRMFFVVYGGLTPNEKSLSAGIREEYYEAAQVPADLSPVAKSKVLGSYILSVLSAPSYQSRYHEEIHQDFPRVPLPRTEETLLAMAKLGDDLFAAECLEIAPPAARFVFSGDLGEESTTPSLVGSRLKIGRTSYIDGVTNEIWSFEIAGYQVCSSWFSAGGRSGLARKGEHLTQSVVSELRRVLYCIEETIRIQKEIDEVIEVHGGWPGAFATNATDSFDSAQSRVGHKAGGPSE